jgi:hypothetical protein
MANLDVKLSDIGDWLQSKVPGFILGQNLQINHALQGAPERCTVLSNNGGSKVDHEPPRIKIEYMLQVYTRAKYWEQANADNNKFYNYLFNPGEVEIFLPAVSPLFRVHVIKVTSCPQQLSPDGKGRRVFSSNYKLTIFAI